MNASAQQVVWEKILHVKVVAAPGTDGECYLDYRPDEKDNPDNKDHGKSIIRMGPLGGHQHHRDI